MPRVLNYKTDEIPKDAVYVGRPTKWGNPYIDYNVWKSLPFEKQREGGLVIVASRNEAVQRYNDYLQDHPELLDDLHELTGKDLTCACAPEACHADILLDLANGD